MNKLTQYLVATVLVFSFASCAKEGVTKVSKVRSGLNKFNDGYTMEKGDHGMMRSSSDKVSEYDRRASGVGSKDFKGKDYNKASYRKKRWGGNTAYKSKQYAGNTDGSRFQHSPHYLKNNYKARAEGQYALANNSQYKTGAFNSGRAREELGLGTDVKKGASTYVTSRDRRPEPLIMSRQDYRKLSVSDSNRMLGR